jgi:CubicO group peptidase (beta-lactamase class C family)
VIYTKESKKHQQKPYIIIIAIILSVICGKTQAQQGFKNIDAWLNEHAHEMGGRVLLLIYKDSNVIYQHGVNNMSRKDKFVQKMFAKKLGQSVDLNDYTTTSRLAIASCSKWLSAALVMTFVDEGKLKLTDTVGQYLPALSQHGKGRITIAQCLSHLTAIKAAPLKENLHEMKRIRSMDEAIENIATLPMEGEPGKVFHYSNVGLQIAGAVVEKISGQSFEALFAERIARPLNMQHTDFGKKGVALPAGGAFSTPQDYLNFLIMILNKGTFNGTRVLSEASIAQMQINRITADVKVSGSPAEAGNFGYGFGEWIMGANAVSSPGLFGSYPWIDNNKKYAAFLLTLNLKRDGRHKRYQELKKLVDEAF